MRLIQLHSIFCLSGTPGNPHPGMGQLQLMTPGNLGMVFSKKWFSDFAIGPPAGEKNCVFYSFVLDFSYLEINLETTNFKLFPSNPSQRHPGTHTREWEWKSQDTREFPLFPGVTPGTKILCLVPLTCFWKT